MKKGLPTEMEANLVIDFNLYEMLYKLDDIHTFRR